MINRPEDRQKVALLGAGVVIILIYFAVFVIPKLMSSGQQQAAPPTDPAAAAATDPNAAAPAALLAAATGTTGANPVVPAPQAVDLYADVDEPPPPSADPFSPPLPTAEMLANSSLPKPLIPVTGPAVGPATSGIPNTPGLATTAPLPIAPKPTITVQGVLTGDDPIAVIKVNSQTLYEHQGARLDSGEIVARITDNGVQFQDGFRQFTLAIGHSNQPDTPAAKPSGPTSGSPAGVPVRPGSSYLNPIVNLSRLPGLARAQQDHVVPVALGANPVSLEDPVPANQIASVAFQAEDSDVAPTTAPARRNAGRRSHQ